MKTALILASCLLLGCADLTPRQRLAVQIGVSVLLVGAIIALDDDNANHRGTDVFAPRDPCVPDPNACR